ncbi:MAG: hypothetical protein ACYTEI_05265, partial [Planctomycetota bacterium]
IDAGTAQRYDVSPTGPGGDGPDDGPSFQPRQINPESIDAGAAAQPDFSSESSADGGPKSQSIPPYVAGPGPSLEEMNAGDASGIAGGATEQPNVGSESESPNAPSTPSIRVKVQGADLTEDSPNIDG